MVKPPYLQERQKGSFKRPYGGRKPPKKRILIVCEGKRTEPLYFKAFHIPSVKVTIEGTGRNTDSLVEFAIEIVESAKENGNAFDQVWCVFDKDDFPAQNFNRAFDLIRSRPKFNIAYSNKAFELWYLLHFHYYNTGISRDQYKRKLSRLLGKKYEKNDPEMYQILIAHQSEAIRNAHNLLDYYPEYNPLCNNPTTTVVDLVEELNKYLD